jgi:hypothetical protein
LVPAVKFEPVTVSAKPPLPAGIEFVLSDVITGSELRQATVEELLKHIVAPERY